MFTMLLVVMFVAIGWFTCYAVVKLSREDPRSVGDEPPVPAATTGPTGAAR